MCFLGHYPKKRQCQEIFDPLLSSKHATCTVVPLLNRLKMAVSRDFHAFFQ